MRTSMGTILIDLYRDKAPLSVANFLRYVDQKLYDGAQFYRASRPAKASETASARLGAERPAEAPLRMVARPGFAPA